MEARNFKIIGYLHSDEITYFDFDKNHRFPKRDIRKETRMEFNGKFYSMDEASLWLISNFPEYYMGHGVVAMDDSGDFTMHCVPSDLYAEYGTTDDNVVIINEMSRLVYDVHFANHPINPVPIEVGMDDIYDAQIDNDPCDEEFSNDEDDDFHKKNYDDEYYYSLMPECVFDSNDEPIMI